MKVLGAGSFGRALLCRDASGTHAPVRTICDYGHTPRETRDESKPFGCGLCLFRLSCVRFGLRPRTGAMCASFKTLAFRSCLRFRRWIGCESQRPLRALSELSIVPALHPFSATRLYLKNFESECSKPTPSLDAEFGARSSRKKVSRKGRVCARRPRLLRFEGRIIESGNTTARA